jgi:hypothetical protein
MGPEARSLGWWRRLRFGAQQVRRALKHMREQQVELERDVGPDTE